MKIASSKTIKEHQYRKRLLATKDFMLKERNIELQEKITTVKVAEMWPRREQLGLLDNKSYSNVQLYRPETSKQPPRAFLVAFSQSLVLAVWPTISLKDMPEVFRHLLCSSWA